MLKQAKKALGSPATWLLSLSTVVPARSDAQSPVGPEQKRFEDVFQSLSALDREKPHQFLELCDLVREARSAGLNIDPALRTLEERIGEDSHRKKMLEDLQFELLEGVSKAAFIPSRELRKGVQEALQALAGKERVSGQALEDCLEALFAQHDQPSVMASVMKVFPRLPASLRARFEKPALLRLAAYANDFYGSDARIQGIFASLQPDAVLFDANRNHRVDSDDFWATPHSREPRTGRLGSLAQEIQVRHAVLNAAEDLDASKPRFASNLQRQVFPEAFFERKADNGVFRARPEVSESVALLSTFTRPDETLIDCAAGSKTLVQYRAALAVLGPEDFDRVFDGLIVGSHMASNAHFLEFKPTGGTSVTRVAPDTFFDELKPGDVVYFGKEHVSEGMREAGWSGEWVTYLGEGMFFGHPVGIKNFDDMQSFGDLRHKKWTLAPSVADYNDGQWSNTYRAYQKTEKERHRAMVKGLEEAEASGMNFGALGIRELLQMAHEKGDHKLVALSERLFQKSVERLFHSVRSGAQTSGRAAEELGVSSATFKQWMEKGPPRAEDVTLAALRLWMDR